MSDETKKPPTKTSMEQARAVVEELRLELHEASRSAIKSQHVIARALNAAREDEREACVEVVRSLRLRHGKGCDCEAHERLLTAEGALIARGAK